MELEPGIHQLTTGQLTTGQLPIGREPFKGFPPPNSYLVFGTDASVLIDAGWSNGADHEARTDYLREAGPPPLTAIIITHRHPDHGGGALALHRSTGAPLASHALEREAIERDRFGGEGRITRELEDGEELDLGGLTLEVVHAPGHTPGCIALFARERGALFTTDTVMGVSTTLIRPGEGSLADYGRTLERLLSLGATTMYAGHGGPIADPASRLQALIGHRQRREAELLDALAERPRKVQELRGAIYAGLPTARERLADMQVVSGLHKLRDEGRVREDGERWARA